MSGYRIGSVAAVGMTLGALACAPAYTASTAALTADRVHTSAHGTLHYRLHVPAGAGRNAPLLLWLHGCTQTPAALAEASRIDSLAAEHRLIVVAPDQPATANALKCWNWFLPGHQARGDGEPALLAALVTEVAAELGADPRRLYVGGLSAGGAMAVVAAIAYPDLFAAAASHSGVGWRMAGDVASALAVMKSGGSGDDSLGALALREMGQRAQPIPLFVTHGLKDAVAVPDGSRSLIAQFTAIARGAGVTMRPDSARGVAGGYGYSVLRYRDPRGRVLIEAWFVDSLGHALSGGAPGVRWTDAAGPDATREMLRFLLDHRR